MDENDQNDQNSALQNSKFKNEVENTSPTPQPSVETIIATSSSPSIGIKEILKSILVSVFPLIAIFLIIIIMKTSIFGSSTITFIFLLYALTLTFVIWASLRIRYKWLIPLSFVISGLLLMTILMFITPTDIGGAGIVSAFIFGIFLYFYIAPCFIATFIVTIIWYILNYFKKKTSV
ncbi:hypothetical protein FWG95_03815 [Candidatus Saccharibacteria bacterium]|nr:hypothetical protein [Candidatus Saccharibacteria bacterium]